MTAVASAALALGFVVILDPFGLRVSAGTPARPLMDINQRYMYPQLVRSGAFDAAVFGTSTLRLLDPQNLSRGIGGRFVNLAMNAATPWEQVQIVTLFRRQVGAPRAIIWGIDTFWCDADATEPAKRLTPRPFPPWLYGSPSLLDAPRQLSFTTLEIAGRLFAHRLGLMPERIRGDGYEVFTPPETLYDLARARAHIYAAHGGAPPDMTPVTPPDAVDAALRASWRFPALAWLDQAVASFPAGTPGIIVLPPIHAGQYPRQGSTGWQRFAACKAQIAAIADKRGMALVDYAFPSTLTRPDENFWDAVHYRLPTARRIEADLAAVASGAAPPVSEDAQFSVPAR
ncbi:MAG: hypothetical protein ACK4VM_10595 [Bosea sp. (in: a-proteobacteria)]